MWRQTNNRDYFCELLMLIPGLAEVFDDYHPGDTGGLRYKEKYDAGRSGTGEAAAPPGRVYASPVLVNGQGYAEKKDAV